MRVSARSLLALCLAAMAVAAPAVRADTFSVSQYGKIASTLPWAVAFKKGFLHLIVPQEQFELIQGEDALERYQFNTGTAVHQFCRYCGIHPFYVPRSDPDKIDVNVRCLDGVEIAEIRPKLFDGRNWEAAMEQDVPWRD